MARAERCFASCDFPEQAFANVQRMIRLANDHDEARVDALCAEALDLNRFASGFLRDRIKNGAGPGRRRDPRRIVIRVIRTRGGTVRARAVIASRSQKGVV